MEALYRKYRPTTFKDVVGQEHIERTLKNAIEQGKVSHAYLFCGPRGTGKTTMARILAKALLCEKGPTTEPDGTCPECEAIAQGTHPDVYELDAASRTGVDNVREEIIARVNYAPTRGAWKVYIIDEVHMLTNAAFNALLKTLEEPPEHILFILCTTDPQKVPDTIQSRCQRFDFHRISNEAIVSRLGAICVEEGVDFEGEALDLIAYRADGGMRNALTSLEQLIAFGDGHVTLEGAQNLLGSLDETDLSEIILAIGKRDAAACFNWVARYVETGADLAQFVSDLSEYVRDLYLLSMAGVEVEISISDATRKVMVDQLKYFGQERLSRLLVVLGDLSKELHTSSNPRLSFEIALTRMVRPESDLTIESLAERVEELERKIASGQAGMMAAQAAAQPAGFQGSPQPPLSQQAPQMASQAPVSQPAPQVQASKPAEQPAVAQSPLQNTAAQPSMQATSQIPAQQGASSQDALQPSASQSPMQAQQPQPNVAPPATMQSGQVSAVPGTLAIDVTNPAAVQRFWHTVTSSLRKANPARGVLFMNAKISGEANGSGLLISFAKDNGFAYTAALKPEVQQLLSQTIDSVAGSHIPYRLVLEGDGRVGGQVTSAMNQGTGAQVASVMVPSMGALQGQGNAAQVNPMGHAAQAAQADQMASAGQAAQAAQAGQMASAGQASQASQAVSQSERVRAAIKAAQAANKAAQTQTQPSVQAASVQSQPQPQPQSQPQPSVQAAPAQPQPQSPVQAASAAPIVEAEQPTSFGFSAGQQAPSSVQAPDEDPSYEEERVPLEAYGDAFSEDEVPEQAGLSGQTSCIQSDSLNAMPSSSGSAAQAVPQSTEQQAGQPAGEPTAQPAMEQAGEPVMETAVQSAGQPTAQEDEASQIKAILTGSFGDGIKFEELSE